MKKISLLSLMSVCMMAPAFATPSHTSDTFPNDELMQEDYTYTGQATYANMGVYSDSVTADAEYDWTLYSPTAGNYLPADSVTITQCPAGSFCGGATNIHYDQSNDQGRTACSTLGDNSYTLSAAGSDDETDCYRLCTVANANITHATAVTGNDYYGAGTDTCLASACENGWTATNGACIANTINITWTGATAAAISANNAGQCTYGGDIRTPSSYDPTAVPTGKHFVGWKFVKTPAGFNLSTLDASIDGTAYGFQNDSVNAYEPESSNTTAYGLTEDNTWGTTFSYGKVRGEARCSTNSGTYATAGDPGSATTGQYCWCKATGYQASGSDTWQDVSSASWVFNFGDVDAANCARGCANLCASHVQNDSGFRGAVFGTSSN